LKFIRLWISPARRENDSHLVARHECAAMIKIKKAGETMPRGSFGRRRHNNENQQSLPRTGSRPSLRNGGRIGFEGRSAGDASRGGLRLSCFIRSSVLSPANVVMLLV
jgi:hypothetical protein